MRQTAIHAAVSASRFCVSSEIPLPSPENSDAARFQQITRSPFGRCPLNKCTTPTFYRVLRRGRQSKAAVVLPATCIASKHDMYALFTYCGRHGRQPNLLPSAGAADGNVLPSLSLGDSRFTARLGVRSCRFYGDCKSPISPQVKRHNIGGSVF